MTRLASLMAAACLALLLLAPARVEASSASQVTLTISLRDSVPGESVTFTATVTNQDPQQTIVPTGNVIFKVDNQALSPVSLDASGSATYTTSTLSLGTHTVSATYSGDARLLGSKSDTFFQDVISMMVTNASANGSGSLSAALIYSWDHPGPDTITFDPTFFAVPRTISPKDPLEILDDVTIDASGLASAPTIDCGPIGGFQVLFGEKLVLKGITLSNARNARAITNYGTVELTQSTLSNNSSGAIENYSGSTATLHQCILSDNVTRSPGGAILNGNAILTMTQCTLSGNSGYNGGAIRNANGGTATLNQCTLSNNRVDVFGGGAIANYATMTLNQCTLTGNSTDVSGGAISNTTGTLTLVHCTVSGNSANAGGGIDNGSACTLTNTIIAGNTATQGAASGDDIYNKGIVTWQGVNIAQRMASDSSGKDTGPPAINSAPMLAPLSSYGGPTRTMPPLPGSPAIDQAGVLNPALTTDQRGQPMPLGLLPDIGAVEAGIITVDTRIDELDPPGVPGNGVSLREAVRDIPAGGTIIFDRGVFSGSTSKSNDLILSLGPLNPARNLILNGSDIPGSNPGMDITTQLNITQQPQPLDLAAGAKAIFSVTVTNASGGVTYQWRKNGQGIFGATGPTLTINSVQESNEGLYDVIITEDQAPLARIQKNFVRLFSSTVTSQPALLRVGGISDLAILRQPTKAFIDRGSNYPLSVIAVCPDPLTMTYQWAKDNKDIPGATQSTYVIANAQLASAGRYTCTVKAGTASLQTQVIEIGVVERHYYTVDLQPGKTFTATAIAAGNDLVITWGKLGPPGSSDGGTIYPEHTASFTITSAGQYWCSITGAAGSTFPVNADVTVSSGKPGAYVGELPAATIGQDYYFRLSQNTGITYAVKGTLPAGMKYDKTTSIFSGRPTASKPAGYPLVITGSNAAGAGLPRTLVLAVNTVPASAVGVFTGPVNRSPLNDNLGGRFDLTTTAAGTFSGSVTLGTRKLSFVKQLLLSAGADDVILRGNITGLAMPDKSPLTAYVEFFALESVARLTLIDKTGTSVQATAWRNPWLVSKNTALDHPATAYAAYYTLRLDPQVLGDSPRGYGYSSFTISPAGALTLAGKLPDGSAITGGTFVGAHGEILLFNLLYGNRGSHMGQFRIAAATPVASNAVTGTTSWFKPAPLPNSKDTVYQTGFGTLTVTADGSPYTAPGKGQRVMSLPAAVSPATNAQLGFTLGGLDTEAMEFTQTVRIANPKPTGLTNTATMGTPLLNKTSMPTITASTGAFSGSFTLPGATAALNRPAPFYGQIVKIGATTQGYGFFLLSQVPTGTQKVSTAPKLSGRVVLGVP